jgi:cytochrome c553
MTALIVESREFAQDPAMSTASPKTRFLLFLLPVFAVYFSWPADLDGQAPALDGKKLFLEQKCETCHGVAAAGLSATTKLEKMKGPDLSGFVAADPAAMVAFIRQEKDLAGVKHKKAVKASDAELQAILKWLAEQKKPD